MATRNPMLLRRVLVGLIVVTSVALALTTVTTDGGAKTDKEKSLFAGSNVPLPVRAILQRACQDCHSKNTVWPWYSHIPPISRQIHTDVERGRAFMDLSKWNDYTESQRRGFTTAIGAAVQNHVMPPPKYVWMHHEARLSSDELALVRAWVLAGHKTARQ
jgi:Haem-binding domain